MVEESEMTTCQMQSTAALHQLKELARRDPEAAQRELAACTILKFHGRPKPEEVLHPWRHPRATILRHPLHPRLWSYLADDIRAHWR